MKQFTKKALYKKKPRKDCGHWEGKYWCNCITRNIRYYLGKKYGQIDQERQKEDGQDDE